HHRRPGRLRSPPHRRPPPPPRRPRTRPPPPFPPRRRRLRPGRRPSRRRRRRRPELPRHEGRALVGRRIRWLGVVLVVCFALVIVQLVNIQFRQAGALANSPNNPRVAATKYDNDRGVITASDGTVLAKSVKINSSSGAYNFEREYPGGSL